MRDPAFGHFGDLRHCLPRGEAVPGNVAGDGVRVLADLLREPHLRSPLFLQPFRQFHKCTNIPSQKWCQRGGLHNTKKGYI